MSHPLYHSRSSSKKFGGIPQDYIHIHNFFDQTKAHIADSRHRMILHNSLGIFLAEQVFGVSFKRQSDGKDIPTRLIGEQHVLEDFGFIPTVYKCFESMEIKDWMIKGAKILSKEFK